jgi:hypothetical protein
MAGQLGRIYGVGEGGLCTSANFACPTIWFGVEGCGWWQVVVVLVVRQDGYSQLFACRVAYSYPGVRDIGISEE